MSTLLLLVSQSTRELYFFEEGSFETSDISKIKNRVLNTVFLRLISWLVKFFIEFLWKFYILKDFSYLWIPNSLSMQFVMLAFKELITAINFLQDVFLLCIPQICLTLKWVDLPTPLKFILVSCEVYHYLVDVKWDLIVFEGAFLINIPWKLLVSWPFIARPHLMNRFVYLSEVTPVLNLFSIHIWVDETILLIIFQIFGVGCPQNNGLVI